MNTVLISITHLYQCLLRWWFSGKYWGESGES
ncbi:MAG: hypothetical protein EZS26_001347 [Candidatus Ordinivivax streblomastigis]|uniref:Uncharacterized protein n=1 Tax=Candidatus Ordinivivax streblomastigis TaxID=2540710 RepID=A0A5M8P229_9BACT|nr:MAG: hypothetical protein EZS26_001347 [Candidatus Ordinivivax streblomastigis]